MSQGPTKGVPIDTDASLSTNSDQLVASQKATKAYVDAKLVSVPVSIGSGGTGQTTAANAITALTGTQTSGYYLRSNGSAAALAAILSTDLALYQQFTAPADGVSAGLTFTPTSNITHVAYYRREGKYLVIDGHFTLTGTGSAGNLTLTINGLPGTPLIDTNYIPGGTTTTNAGQSILGYGQAWSQGVSTWFYLNPVYASTSTIQFVAGGIRIQGNTYASGSTVNYCVKAPIVGWS